jgi:hypothetical protein
MISKKELDEWFIQSNDGWADHIISTLWEECTKLESENRDLHDKLAMMHTITTDSYERRRSTAKQKY